MIELKRCARTQLDLSNRPWFLRFILFQTICFNDLFQTQPSALWIISNFDSSCSLFEVIGDNLRSTFLSATLYLYIYIIIESILICLKTLVVCNLIPVMTLPVNPLELEYDFLRVMYLDRYRVISKDRIHFVLRIFLVLFPTYHLIAKQNMSQVILILASIFLTYHVYYSGESAAARWRIFWNKYMIIDFNQNQMIWLQTIFSCKLSDKSSGLLVIKLTVMRRFVNRRSLRNRRIEFTTKGIFDFKHT